MGGEHEVKITKAPAVKGAILTQFDQQVLEIRIHEKGGNTHFHCDENHTKVSVRSFVWWGAWEKLATLQQQHWRSYDPETKCLLTVRTMLNEHTGKLDATVFIKRVQGETDVFNSLKTFTKADN